MVMLSPTRYPSRLSHRYHTVFSRVCNWSRFSIPLC